MLETGYTIFVMEVITSHINADFDAFASMVAAKRLYPNAELVLPGSQERKLRDFIDAFHPAEIKRLKEIDLSCIERLIVVDAKSKGRIGVFADITGNPDLKIHVYDHHPSSGDDIRADSLVLEEVGATATIMSEKLIEKGIIPTPIEATLLCLGIYEETGNLLFSSTTERDLMAVVWLLKHGASLKIVSSYMKSELSHEELELLNELVRSSREIMIHGMDIRIAKGSREDYAGDVAHLAHKMMDMEDIDAVVLLFNLQGKTLIVGRSRTPELDMSAVMEFFDGGGHRSAASATIAEMPLEIVEEKILEVLNLVARPGKKAVDIMTKPVVTIDFQSPVKDAEAMMTRYGVNVLPVTVEGKYKGIITREVVEKALFHGFRKTPSIDFTTTDVITAEKESPLYEIESAMIERNQRFVPVLDSDMIVGAITRTDLLRVIYEESLQRGRVRPSETAGHYSIGRSMAQAIKDKFPPRITEILRLAGQIAESHRYEAYLVGGSVRDLLMGRENLDIDIVVEGNGIVFASEMAQSLGARVRTHERFGTAKIIGQDVRLDVATARTEYYESPASLPTVVMSSIKKDLYRRDFTINTLAVRLNPQNFGALVDFFGAQRDIREKTVRVLHNLSFVEDPTRIFRAVRFAERFGFRISRHTENLIRSAIKMSLFDKLSGSRLFEELSLMFDEGDPVGMIKRLSEHELLSVIHPGLLWREEVSNILQAVHDTLLWFNLSFMDERANKRMIYLTALMHGLKEEERTAVMKRLSVSKKFKDAVFGAIDSARELLRGLPARDPVVLYDLLIDLPVETLLFAMAVTNDQSKKKEITAFLLDLRSRKTAIGGAYLKKLGIGQGPVYSKILRMVLHERLRGNLSSREEEESFVKSHIKEFGIT